MSLEAVFQPKRVALVGASDQPGKVGTIVWQNLRAFAGEVIPVTNSSQSVDGVEARASLADVDGEVDLAVLAVPGRATPEIAEQARAKGVRAMIVLSAGFGEVGADGEALQVRLAEAAGPVRIVGPNCFGVQNTANGLNASIAAGTGAEVGGIALITQSGAYGMAIHAMAADENARFSKVYASGNKMDIDDPEVIQYLRGDPATSVICLFTESVQDGGALAAAVRATTASKPVVVSKTGRSAAGQRSAQSHTGSLAVSESLFAAAMSQAGAIQVRTGLEMLDVARALAEQPLPLGTRAAIITNSGGTGVELVDLLAEHAVEVPELSPELQDQIAERLPEYASPANPVDMTPVWPRFAELYPWLIDTLARSGEVDMVVPILLQRSASDVETVTAVRDCVAGLQADGVDVPVYCCWVAPEASRGNRAILQTAGIPCFEWPERTARAIAHVVGYVRSRGIVASPPLPPPLGRALPAGPLGVTAASELLESFGVGLVESVECRDAAAAVESAERLGFPVVMKAADERLAHRTDAGGVRLGLSDREATLAAYEELAPLGPRVLVQPEIGGVEMVVGGVQDPVFGPVVMVGTGGTLVELVGDVVFALAPVSDDEALRLIRSLKGSELLDGFRGSRSVDAGCLASLVARVSRLLVAHPEIEEVDLNPVIVHGGGAVAVDWKINVGERYE